MVTDEERAQNWTGVHCVNALLDGEPMTDHWFDRIRKYAVRNQGQDFEHLRYATEETVEFSPILCSAHLSPEVYQARIKTLVEVRDRRGSAGAEPGPKVPGRKFLAPWREVQGGAGGGRRFPGWFSSPLSKGLDQLPVTSPVVYSLRVKIVARSERVFPSL